MIEITPAIAIDEKEIREVFVRSSGPGGQHVNKVSTAVQLRFDAAHSPSLPPHVRHRLSAICGSRMTAAGEMIITAQRFRSREQNRRDAQDRLVELIRRAAKPIKNRRATYPSSATRKRRLTDKRHRSRLKTNRRKPGMGDW